jgi:hypothetical protein
MESLRRSSTGMRTLPWQEVIAGARAAGAEHRNSERCHSEHPHRLPPDYANPRIER